MKHTETFNYDEITGMKFGAVLFGKAKLFSHVYFVDGLLIDTGHSRMRKQVATLTKELPVEQMFITHHHEDHSGNIEVLQQQFRCEVFAPSLCCSMMKKPPRLSFGQKVTWGNRPPYHSLKAKDGLITTPKYQFKLIPIPGHAPDMVALYEPDRKWLFSADLYINAYIGYFLADEHIYQQVASIKKILTLDFEVLLCSHNPQFENGKQKLKDKLAFLEDFIDRASGLYRKGYSVKEIFQMMELKENKVVNFISGGHLSKLNMVKSVVRYVDEA